MKLKFRASVKDVVIFFIFCVFLLYLVAIAVLNLHYFSNYGYFYGLNPFPAFGPDLLVSTLVFYLLALVGVFMSVSSYFFEREKGFGYTSKKKEESKGGWAKWMEETDMKKAYDIKQIDLWKDEYDHSGVPIIIEGKKQHGSKLQRCKAWVDDGENHTLIMGASGSGKTWAILDSLVKILGRRGESMIITDPKGEIYENNANMLREYGYKVIILNFRDPKYGACWNPFSYPYRLWKEGNHDKSQELLEDLSNNILIDPNSKAEPFWENNAADYFTGLALGLFEDAIDENQVNLNSINLMHSVGEDRIGATRYINEYFKLKDPLSGAYVSASSTINAPADTRGSVTSVFKQKIRIFSSREELSKMLSRSDFDLRDIGREKTALFIKIHDEKTTYHALATILVKQIYESLIEVAQTEEGNKLKIRTNFLLDEFANMPALKDVESMVTASRSRRIRFTFVVQNFSQLNKVYGKEVAETIKGNCGNMIYLMTTEYQALEEFSKLCGDVEPKVDKDKPAPPVRPLVSVSDLQQMKQFEIIIKRFRNQPFKTKLVPSFEIDWGNNYGKSGYPETQMDDVRVFDLKTFVDKKREEKGLAKPFSPGSMNFVPPFTSEEKTFGKSNSVDDNKQSINVDDLVKRIDAKIAELEEEERRENEAKKMQSEKNTFEPGIINNNSNSGQNVNVDKQIDDNELNRKLKDEEKKLEEKPAIEKPNINVDEDSIVINDQVIDDDFFDDFFDDEV